MFTKTPFQPDTEGVWLDLPAEVYHNAPGVSQSTLKEFDEHASPLHFKTRKRKSATADMQFGTICHAAVLEPRTLAEVYYVQPEVYPAVVKGKKGEMDSTISKPWSNNADWCKEWNKEHNNRPIINAEREADIPKIVARLNRLTEFSEALQHGVKEVSFFKRDDVTGLLCKCRVDCLATTPDGVRWIFDMKKVQSGGASHDEFSKSCGTFGYHVQAASYLSITGAAHFVFVPFDDAEPFDAGQFTPDAEMLSQGRQEYRRMLDAYAACVKADYWPGYADGIKPIKLPPYAVKKMTQAQHEVWALRVATGSY